MSNKEKQVEELLAEANEALNFFRLVLDGLFLQKDRFKNESLNRLIMFQQSYKKHKAVLTNIKLLLSNRSLPLPSGFAKSLAKSLRKRISIIIEDSIEIDKLR